MYIYQVYLVLIKNFKWFSSITSITYYSTLQWVIIIISFDASIRTQCFKIRTRLQFIFWNISCIFKVTCSTLKNNSNMAKYKENLLSNLLLNQFLVNLQLIRLYFLHYFFPFFKPLCYTLYVIWYYIYCIYNIKSSLFSLHAKFSCHAMTRFVDQIYSFLS